MVTIQFLILIIVFFSIISIPILLIIKKLRKIAIINLIIIGLYFLIVTFPIIPYFNKGFYVLVKNDNNINLKDITITIIRNRYYLNTKCFLPLIDPIESKEYIVGSYLTDFKGKIYVNGSFDFLRLFELNHEEYIIFSNIKHHNLTKVNIYELENNLEVVFPNQKYFGNILITSSIKNNEKNYSKYYIRWIDTSLFYNKFEVILRDTADN